MASIWMVKGSFVPKLSWSLMSTTFLLRQNPHDWYHLIPILVRYLLEFRLSSSSHGSLAVLLHDHPADCSRVVPPPSALTNGEVHQPINPRYPCHCCEQVVMICLEKCNIVIWYQHKQVIITKHNVIWHPIIWYVITCFIWSISILFYLI